MAHVLVNIGMEGQYFFCQEIWILIQNDNMSTMECPYLPCMTTRAGFEDYKAPGTMGMNIVKWSL